MEAQLDIKTLWQKVVDDVKQKVIHPTLWQTLEMAVPITAESNQFVVGLAVGDFHYSGHLTSSEHKNAIENALREFSGVSFSLRVIEGNTARDWEAVKTKDERMAELQEAARRKREQDTALSKSWDGLMEQVGRSYAAVPLRQLPQFRAKYIAEMLQVVSDTIDVLMPEGSPVNEISERSLARVIEKVGTLTETPSAIIALELERLRSGR